MVTVAIDWINYSSITTVTKRITALIKARKLYIKVIKEFN